MVAEKDGGKAGADGLIETRVAVQRVVQEEERVADEVLGLVAAVSTSLSLDTSLWVFSAAIVVFLFIRL